MTKLEFAESIIKVSEFKISQLRNSGRSERSKSIRINRLTKVIDNQKKFLSSQGI